MAELVDAQRSERCESNLVEVRVLSAAPPTMKYFVYILECRDKSLYTGIALNLNKRIKEHFKGTSKYTRSKLPVKLVYFESQKDKVDAAKREWEIKGWSRKKKLELVNA